LKELQKIATYLAGPKCMLPEKELLESLTLLRTAIRERRCSEPEGTLRFAENFPAWLGEIHFVVALAFETLENHEKSKLHYRIAADELARIGAKRKALKADMNHLAADSCIEPDSKRLIADYLFGYRQARKLKEFGIAGTVLNNVSREYHRIGAYAMALKFSNRAVALLERDFGTLHYYLAIVHRAHVLLDLGRSEEAQLDLDRARASTFIEVKSALALLEDKEAAADAKHLTPSWRERKATQAPTPLTELENQLIELLSQEPREKFELMDALYGKKLSFEVRENRFKVLLSRLRTKRPGLIVLKKARYHLSEVASVSLPIRRRIVRRIV